MPGSLLEDKSQISGRNIYLPYPLEKREGLGSEHIFVTNAKIRSVMDRCGYANCCRVTDYRHPFDTYDGQDVLIFEKFRDGLKHGDMLNYLDGYPLLLPCRYFNRQACYTKVFIITNIPPDAQYMNVDLASREAFYRRIHKVIEFRDGPYLHTVSSSPSPWGRFFAPSGGHPSP